VLGYQTIKIRRFV